MFKIDFQKRTHVVSFNFSIKRDNIILLEITREHRCFDNDCK